MCHLGSIVASEEGSITYRDDTPEPTIGFLTVLFRNGASDLDLDGAYGWGLRGESKGVGNITNKLALTSQGTLIIFPFALKSFN